MKVEWSIKKEYNVCVSDLIIGECFERQRDEYNHAFVYIKTNEVGTGSYTCFCSDGTLVNLNGCEKVRALNGCITIKGVKNENKS